MNIIKINSYYDKEEEENYKQSQKRFNDIKRISKDFYIEFYNNYLTIQKISEHYEISEELGKELIDLGRTLLNDKENQTND